jgi:hypothetical protein
MTTTNYFYDCEFYENGQTIDLISIGIVAEDDREYYAINSNFMFSRVPPGHWLEENVYPHLPVVKEGFGYRWPTTRDNFVFKTPIELKREVYEFITSRSMYWYENRLWAYCGAYDHVALGQLYGRMIDLPNGIPYFTSDLKGLWMDSGRPEKPPKRNLHSAIDDARWNKKLYEVCKEVRT